MNYLKIFVYAFCIFSSDLFAQVVTYTSGTVGIASEEDGLFKKVSTGDKVPYGTFIKTEADSLAIISFPEGSTLKIDPESKVELQQVVSEEDKKTTNIYHLIKGAILSKFINNGDQELVVEGEHVALAVRGTEFFFGEDENQYFAAVNSGEVAVVKKDDYDYESLSAGKAIVVEDKKNLTLPAAYLWAKSLNWYSNKDSFKSRSGFRNEKLRALRKQEVGSRLSSIRQRKKKLFDGGFKRRMEKAFIRKGLRQKLRGKTNDLKGQKLKKTLDNKSPKRPQKVQEFKKKMRKRGVLRRRRN